MTPLEHLRFLPEWAFVTDDQLLEVYKALPKLLAVADSASSLVDVLQDRSPVVELKANEKYHLEQIKQALAALETSND